MPKFELKEYFAIESYTEALEAFHAVSGIVLFEFAREERKGRDLIIRNFIARTDTMARAIFRLWDLQDYQDCWILHRCLLDRLFHLYHLNENNQFEVFEAWSFLQQYNAVNRVRSDPEFGDTRESRMFGPNEEQKQRAQNLSSNPPVWQRPKAEDVAKRLDMQFLYRFGFDFASTHVHPMANDGSQDFFTITKITPAPEFPDQRSVLSNTLLVATMILQQALNASTLSWRDLVYGFLDDLLTFLGTGLKEYRLRVLELARLFKDGIRLAAENTSR